ncbi:hypothetical protein HHI36_013283, partial [Cryptolaemus montrouzieri]
MFSEVSPKHKLPKNIDMKPILEMQAKYIDSYIHEARVKRRTKYIDLSHEIKDIHRVQKVLIHPIVISCNGLIEIHVKDELLKLGIEKPEKLLTLSQKGNNKTATNNNREVPDAQCLTDYWSSLWSKTKEHNKDAEWITNEKQHLAHIIDITISVDIYIHEARVKRITKYIDLSQEIKDIHRVQKVLIHSIVISCNGLIEIHVKDELMKLGIEKPEKLLTLSQEIVILGTCRTVRR